MRTYLSLLILFVLFSGLFAREGKILGVVLDGQTSQPLPAANILLEDLKLGTASDENGEFFFENVKPGKHLLSVSFVGYEIFKTDLMVKPGETTKITVKMQPTLLPGQGVVIVATRARERETPVVFSNISEEYIKENYSVQDIPMLLTEIPNVYSYADAGNPMGYTYLKVRGFDQSRVGVMINGIPLNDPEDHQVYWVDMPDFAESLQDIQFQRGVGSSIYGVATFGGSLNLITKRNIMEPGSEVFLNYGSYNTRKYGAKVQTGLVNNSYQLHLRFSRLLSDGYRENSGTDMIAYYATLSRYGKKSVTHLNVYGGKEITHAAWEASPEDILEKNHRHNPISYPNTIDDFSQPHFELHHSYHLSKKLSLHNTLFFIHGKGYYESYKKSRNLWEYGLLPVDNGEESDLIRQKWVVKDQFGWVSQAIWQHPGGELTVGSYLSTFHSNHWGEVDWVQEAIYNIKPDFKYYQYFGDKYYLTGYANELFRLTPKVTVLGNLYFQHIRYKFRHGKAGNFSGIYRHRFQVNYDFFNPRFGVNYNLSSRVNIFGNLSYSQREPADNELYDVWQGPDDLGVNPLFLKADTIYRKGQVDYIRWSNPVVKPEALWDYEFGVGYASSRLNIKANLFWMNFNNEIVPFGQVDEDGFPIRGNARRTVHRGIEFSLRWMLPSNFELSGNFAYNDNYFQDFTLYQYDWNTGKTHTIDYSGKTIAGFPDLLTNLRFSYRLPQFTASVHWQHVGKQYLDNTENEDRIIPSHNVVNANLIYRIKNVLGTRSIQISLQFNNLLNKKYYTAGYYDEWEGKNFYWPAAEFNWIAGLRFEL